MPVNLLKRHTLGARKQPKQVARGRFDDLEPVGVVDIGSNSVRLVIYEGAVRAPTALFNEKELCGLGQSLVTTGHLGEESVAKALSALTRFAEVCRIFNVRNIRAVATAAVREASDGGDFIRRVEAILGCKIELLSGEREAELAARGIMMGFMDPDGVAGDLGGGSLELVSIRNQMMFDGITLPIGGLRLMDMSGGRVNKAVSIAGREAARFKWPFESRPKTFYAVGGTWRAIAKLHMAQTAYPIRVMHGYSIPTEEAIAFCEGIRRMKRLDRVPHNEVVARQRRDILPYGAAVLEQTLKSIRPEVVTFSAFGIREGLLFEQLDALTQLDDPLIAFCTDYARLRSRSAELPIELWDWTAPLFASGPLQETDDEKRLRHAACLLYDISWRAHPDYRDEQSLNVIAHAALTGVDHQERLFLALTVYARHAGPSELDGEALSEKIRELATKRTMLRAKAMALALRAAHMLSCGTDGVLPRMPIQLSDTELVLSVPRDLQSLVGDRAIRRFRSLAGFYGVEIRLAEAS